MKTGSENRKKTIMAGSLGAVALICLIYGYETLFGGSSTPVPPPTIAPVTAPAAPVAERPASNNYGSSNKNGNGNAPGVAATKMASTSASLDPTLDESAMLRTESLVYSGSGRNIFSATYTPPPAALPVAKHPARPVPTGPVVPPPPPGPPPPPPIDLKFFGTAKRSNGATQAFLLNGEDVYLASEGDIVARKYKIVSIMPNTIQVTDLQNKDTQTLPLQSH